MLIDLNIIKKVKKKSSFFRKFTMYRKKGKAVFFLFFKWSFNKTEKN